MNPSAPITGNPVALYLPENIWQEMLAHALACLPEEACGLVGGDLPDGSKNNKTASAEQTVKVFLPVENELHSPVRFRMAPAGQLKAFYWLEEHGLELSAIFHSHPRGPRHPSATDLVEFAYPGVLMIIASPQEPAAEAPAAWEIHAYRIDGGLSADLSAIEVPLRLVPPALRQQGLSPKRSAG